MTMSDFSLGGRPYVELHNLLKIEGLCSSGGSAKAAIGEGKVKVDGTVETRKRCKIRTGQTVEFEGKQLNVVA